MHYSTTFDSAFVRFGEEYFGTTDIDWRWLKAMGITESRLDPHAVSAAGAQGVMQLMPATSAMMAGRLGIADLPFNPYTNIQLGAAYARRCWNIWKAEEGIERIRFMLASYNAGPGHIIRAQKIAAAKGLPTDRWECLIGSLIEVTGKHAFETIQYVPRVENHYNKLKTEETLWTH